MTDQTKIALFLAREMGLPNPVAHDYPEVVICTPYPDRISASERGAYSWRPYKDRAQFAEVLLWAVKKFPVEIGAVFAIAMADEDYGVDHDNTDASIIAATLEAIARARGFRDE